LLATLANLSTGMYIPGHDWDYLFATWVNSHGNPALNQSLETQLVEATRGLGVLFPDKDTFVNGLKTLMWKNLGLWLWVTNIASGRQTLPAGHPPISQAVRQRLVNDIMQLGALGPANAVCQTELLQFLHDQFLPQAASAQTQQQQQQQQQQQLP
ncbi:MAG: hypothetical protein ACRC9R_10110, partial [Enterovibrio sp.]